VMILVDGLIVQWVAVSVAVSLLIKHIDHVAATWTTTEPGAELGTTKSHGTNRHCRKGIRVRLTLQHPTVRANARTSACAFLSRVGAVACTRSTQPELLNQGCAAGGEANPGEQYRA
jgi:hypothetical protein